MFSFVITLFKGTTLVGTTETIGLDKMAYLDQAYHCDFLKKMIGTWTQTKVVGYYEFSF